MAAAEDLKSSPERGFGSSPKSPTNISFKKKPPLPFVMVFFRELAIIYKLREIPMDLVRLWNRWREFMAMIPIWNQLKFM